MRRVLSEGERDPVVEFAVAGHRGIAKVGIKRQDRMEAPRSDGDVAGREAATGRRGQGQQPPGRHGAACGHGLMLTRRGGRRQPELGAAGDSPGRLPRGHLRGAGHRQERRAGVEAGRRGELPAELHRLGVDREPDRAARLEVLDHAVKLGVISDLHGVKRDLDAKVAPVVNDDGKAAGGRGAAPVADGGDLVVRHRDVDFAKLRRPPAIPVEAFRHQLLPRIVVPERSPPGPL